MFLVSRSLRWMLGWKQRVHPQPVAQRQVFFVFFHASFDQREAWSPQKLLCQKEVPKEPLWQKEVLTSLTKGSGCAQAMPKTKKKNQRKEGENCKGKPSGSGTVSDKRRELFKSRALQRELSNMSLEDKNVLKFKSGKTMRRLLTQEEIDAMLDACGKKKKRVRKRKEVLTKHFLLAVLTKHKPPQVARSRKRRPVLTKHRPPQWSLWTWLGCFQLQQQQLQPRCSEPKKEKNWNTSKGLGDWFFWQKRTRRFFWQKRTCCNIQCFFWQKRSTGCDSTSEDSSEVEENKPAPDCSGLVQHDLPCKLQWSASTKRGGTPETEQPWVRPCASLLLRMEERARGQILGLGPPSALGGLPLHSQQGRCRWKVCLVRAPPLWQNHRRWCGGALAGSGEGLSILCHPDPQEKAWVVQKGSLPRTPWSSGGHPGRTMTSLRMVSLTKGWWGELWQKALTACTKALLLSFDKRFLLSFDKRLFQAHFPWRDAELWQKALFGHGPQVKMHVVLGDF